MTNWPCKTSVISAVFFYEKRKRKRTYLTVVFEPLGSDAWDCIIYLSFAAGHSVKSLGCSFPHRFKEVLVHILFQVDIFLYNHTHITPRLDIQQTKTDEFARNFCKLLVARLKRVQPLQG